MIALLLFLIVLMLGIHWFPYVTLPAIALLTAYFLILWLRVFIPDWLEKRRNEKAHQRQLDKEEPLREEFWEKQKAIRDKYDPNREWNESTLLPPEYEQEMKELNDKYGAVMDRWYGR